MASGAGPQQNAEQEPSVQLSSGASDDNPAVQASGESIERHRSVTFVKSEAALANELLARPGNRQRSVNFPDQVVSFREGDRENGHQQESGNGEGGENGDQDEDGDYDPYLGLGAGPIPPQPPMWLVFRLMDSRRFKKFSEAECRGRNRWGRLATYMGSMLLAAVFFFCFILFCHHLRYYPHFPAIQVQMSGIQDMALYPVKPEIIIQQQEEGKGNYYAFKFNLNFWVMLNVTNPNRHIHFHFDLMELTVYYRGYRLAYDCVRDIALPAGSIRRPAFFLVAVAGNLPLNVGYMLKPEYEVVDFVVVIEIFARSKMSLMPGLRPLAFCVKFRCTLHTTMDGSVSDGCRPTQSKWPPANSDMKFYRTPQWPVLWEDWQKGKHFVMPDEYYDPEINYYNDQYSGYFYHLAKMKDTARNSTE